MNILITGALGFVGSHIARRLSKKHHIFNLDRFNTNYPGYARIHRGSKGLQNINQIEENHRFTAWAYRQELVENIFNIYDYSYESFEQPDVPIDIIINCGSLSEAILSQYYKDFTHQSIVEGLQKALSHDSQNYILGLPCPCCSDPAAVEECRQQAKKSATSWANLLLNANYNHFIDIMLNLILERPVMAAVNYRCDISLFNVCPMFKWFKIPDGVLQKAPTTCDRFLEACSKLPDHTVVLVSASAVAKIMIQKGNQYFPSLTFLHVGTTLNPLLKLGLGRDYLYNYWKPKTAASQNGYGGQTCIW